MCVRRALVEQGLHRQFDGVMKKKKYNPNDVAADAPSRAPTSSTRTMWSACITRAKRWRQATYRKRRRSGSLALSAALAAAFRAADPARADRREHGRSERTAGNTKRFRRKMRLAAALRTGVPEEDQMEEARRFLRYVMPGLVYGVQTLLWLFILFPDWTAHRLASIPKRTLLRSR